MVDFAARLRALADERGLQPADVFALLRKHSDISFSSVDRWFRGDRMPRLEHARALADVFQISLDELYPSQETADAS